MVTSILIHLQIKLVYFYYYPHIYLTTVQAWHIHTHNFLFQVNSGPVIQDWLAYTKYQKRYFNSFDKFEFNVIVAQLYSLIIYFSIQCSFLKESFQR